MGNKKLSEAKGMSHNLHFLRFIAAIIVIMSHSFALSTGDFESEWFYLGTKGQITGGAFAVGIFFLYSGFLITRSLKKNPSCKVFICGRCVRIFPVLAVVTILSVFILGPVVTEFSISSYLMDGRCYRYFLNSIFVLQHNLPGVFIDNVYTSTVNGALWTLPVEFICYMLCLIAYKLKILSQKRVIFTIPVVIAGSMICYYLSVIYIGELLLTALFPVLCFYAGVLYCVFEDKIVMNIKIAVFMLMLTVDLGLLGFLKAGIVLCFTYCLMYAAFGMKNQCDQLWKWGNLSYSMYLCGFPIQQTVIYYFGGEMNPYLNIVISIPCIILLSYLLYHFVEERVTDIWKTRGER